MRRQMRVPIKVTALLSENEDGSGHQKWVTLVQPGQLDLDREGVGRISAMLTVRQFNWIRIYITVKDDAE